MAVTKTHNEFMLRPPPGARFTLGVSIFGQDAFLQFEHGKEREVVEWLHRWIDQYIEPVAKKAEAKRAKELAESDDVRQERVTEEIKAMMANAEHNAIKPRAAKGANRSANFKPEMFEQNPAPIGVKLAQRVEDGEIPPGVEVVEIEVGHKNGAAV